MKALRLFLFMLIINCFLSCQDVVDVDLVPGAPVLVVDGWLTSKKEVHFVSLYYSKGVSQNSAYEPASDASVVLTDNAGHKEQLKEVEPGKYAISTIRGASERTYTLSIVTAQGSYEAKSVMPRSTLSPDTITYRYQEKSSVYKNAGYYAMLNGREVEGKGDYAQIRLYRNGEYLKKADDLNLFSDEYSDGFYLRNMVLNMDTPFAKGDHIRVEVWSLTEHAYLFWSDVESQLHNAQIFATPLVNAKTNVQKVTPSSADVTGYFGVSMVRSAETTVK